MKEAWAPGPGAPFRLWNQEQPSEWGRALLNSVPKGTTGWGGGQRLSRQTLGPPTQSPGSLPPALGRCFPWSNSTMPELPGISNTSIAQGIRWAFPCPYISVPLPLPTHSPI